ncbi:L,D-transpeptidase family protein [Clostridium sediminicola]
MALYFTNHFYFGSTLNCISVSGKSVESVNQLMSSELQKYELNLKERGGKNEKIRGDEIGLTYESGNEFKDSIEEQNPFKWILEIFKTEDNNMVEGLKFDEKLLKEKVDNLFCFDSANIIEPKNPSFKYNDSKYEIVPEVNGNKVKKYILYNHIEDAILKGETLIDLESINCYVKPEYTSDSEKIIDAKNLLNKYVSSKITYTLGKNKECLDSSTIKNWLTVNEDMIVKFDEEKVKDFINTLAKKYNTVGRKRSFVTSSGKKIKVGGGDYGWSIDIAKETKALAEAIKAGEVVTKEPAYNRTALCHGGNDIGTTYVEINLTSQHLWFYKNSSLISEGPVVTGNVSANNTTPAGIYKLKYKQKNAILHGDNYETEVAYWMPFNGGIGIHDATWRSTFGGTIYKTSGSHGCVNSPYNLAKKIFNNIRAGVPVICYN